MKNIKITMNIEIEGLDELLNNNKIENKDSSDELVCSEYSRYCEGLSNKDIEHFIKCIEQIANYKLKRNGYVYLNEVYAMLGLPKSVAGDIVGWVKDNPLGDGHIVITIGGFTKRILDFNVDGNVKEILYKNKEKEGAE